MNVVVVGAGPAGLMAAEVLASAGHRVAVYDQRRSPARKFVLAGRGGLNITHSEPIESFLGRYGPESRHLETAIRGFTPSDLRNWCAGLGHETFVGTSGRVFPEDFRAVPMLRSWLRRLRALGVTLHPQHTWTGWPGEGEMGFATPNGAVAVPYDAAILALGGASWPKVSSDGSWQQTLTERGVAVNPLRAANSGVHVAWSDVMVERFAGEPIKNSSVIVQASTSDGSEAMESIVVRGDPVVTRTGLEGGPIYAHARRIREHLDRGAATISIDLFPDLDFHALEERLSSKRGKRDTAAKWLKRGGVSSVGASLMREATGNDLPRDPARIAELAKAVPVDVIAMAGIDRAISSAGGIMWGAVDENFQLRAIPGVYAVGEMLDWEAPTGGYLLQACFSTAHGAASWIASASADRVVRG